MSCRLGCFYDYKKNQPGQFKKDKSKFKKNLLKKMLVIQLLNLRKEDYKQK